MTNFEPIATFSLDNLLNFYWLYNPNLYKFFIKKRFYNTNFDF